MKQPECILTVPEVRCLKPKYQQARSWRGLGVLYPRRIDDCLPLVLLSVVSPLRWYLSKSIASIGLEAHVYCSITYEIHRDGAEP